MLTKTVEFFGETIPVNVSASLMIYYKNEFDLDLNDFYNNLVKTIINSNNDISNFDFTTLSNSIKLAFLMVKYGTKPAMNITFDDFLSQYSFMELKYESIKLCTVFIDTMKTTDIVGSSEKK